MTLGTLYGVGVGPGAPDLITLRAQRVLQAADVLALPRSSDYGASVAWKIVKPVLGEVSGQTRLFLTFPMSHDPERLRPAWQAALEAIAPHLQAGRSVAFATEGDPSLFSTFTYVRRAALERFPDLHVEVVPGISSVMTVPAVSGVPLADGEERIAIVPAAYEPDLEAVLTSFDTTVLMKIGPAMPQVVDTIERLGLLERAVYVSKASMEEQRIERDVRAVRESRGDCFAMIVVARKERSGRLEQHGPQQEEP